MNILFVKVPWMKYYTGEGDEETLVPACGYLFQHVNGYYYGYTEGMDQIPVECFEKPQEDLSCAEHVTVVWVAENREGQTKVVGWYKEAIVYAHAQEKLTLDSERTIFKYAIKAPAHRGVLLPVELRLLDVTQEEMGMHFEKDPKVLQDITMYMHQYTGDQMNYLFQAKDLEGKSVLNFPDYEMYFMKADEFLQKNFYGKALRLFNKAISLEPDLTMGYECKGSILLSLKMYDAAEKVYAQLLALDPEHEEALYCMGLVKGLLEDYKSCVEYLDQYIKIRKEDVNAISERGIAYYNLGDLEAAQRDFEAAYHKEPENEMFVNLIKIFK